MAECPDCSVEEGHLHEPGCGFERCPFCGEQLISCDCVYEKLRLFDRDKYDESTSFLPPGIYEEGINEEQESRWDEILAGQGRLPWIRYPNVCAKCGALYPDLFMVDTPVWEHYIEPSERDKIICRECFAFIVRATDEHSGRPAMDVVYRKRLGGPPIEDAQARLGELFEHAKSFTQEDSKPKTGS